MHDDSFLLIPGRTSRQGTGLNEGKYSSDYQEEINTLLMAPADMQRLGIANGQRVHMRSEWGEAEALCRPAKGDELPPGILFISYGDISCRLMGGETHGTGMPTSKGFDVWVTPLSG